MGLCLFNPLFFCQFSVFQHFNSVQSHFRNSSHMPLSAGRTGERLILIKLTIHDAVIDIGELFFQFLIHILDHVAFLFLCKGGELEVYNKHGLSIFFPGGNDTGHDVIGVFLNGIRDLERQDGDAVFRYDLAVPAVLHMNRSVALGRSIYNPPS